ncbi:MAG: cation:proton antiporter [Bacteroidota bacterium]
MEIAPVIVFVGLLIFMAHFFVALFEKIRVPDVLYLIVIGLILGPVFRIVRPEDFGKVGHVFTTIALVIILFEGGLDLGIAQLRKSWRETVFITILSYFVSAGMLTVAIYYLTDLNLHASFFVSAVLAGPAPSVIIPLVKNLRLKDSSKTTLTLESSLGEALCIVVALAVLEAYKVEEVRVGRVIGSMVASFLFALVIGGIGGYVWSILLNKMRQLRNAIITTPSFAFIIYGVADFLGFSGPIAVLTFGIVLGNIGIFNLSWLEERLNLTPIVHNETEKLFFGELVFVVKTFFFVFIGLSVEVSNYSAMAFAITLTGVLLFSRYVAVRLSVNKQTSGNDALLMSVLVPKGTAAAVLASLPLQMGILGADLIQNLTYGVVTFSILISAGLVYLLERAPLEPSETWLFSGFGSSGQENPRPPSATDSD